jgi:hypothetical protein
LVRQPSRWHGFLHPVRALPWPFVLASITDAVAAGRDADLYRLLAITPVKIAVVDCSVSRAPERTCGGEAHGPDRRPPSQIAG